METKTCKVCRRELPLAQFANNRYGTPLSTCRECVKEKRAQSRYERSQIGGGVKPLPFLTRTSTAKNLESYGVRCAEPRSGWKAVDLSYSSPASITKRKSEN